MGRYNIYAGQFVCQICGAPVSTLRSYPSEKKLTWMCKDKHLSEVDMSSKKSKKDYE